MKGLATYRKPFLGVLRVLIGVGLLYYVVFEIGGGLRVGVYLENPLLLPGLAALAFLGAFLEAWRLRILCRSQNAILPPGLVFRLVAVGIFFNSLIPGGTGGDLLKLYYLNASHKGKGVELTLVLLVERATGLLALFIVVLLLGFSRLESVAAHQELVWLLSFVAFATVLLVGGAVLSLFFDVRRFTVYSWVMARLPLSRYIRRLFDAAYAYRSDWPTLVGALGISLLVQGMLAAMFAWVGLILAGDQPPGLVSFLALIGTVANAVPITPGGIGVAEAAFESLFAVVGEAGGALLMFSWRLGTVPLLVVGGLVYVLGFRGTSESAGEGRVTESF